MSDHVPELVARKAEQLLVEFCAQPREKLNCPHVTLAYRWEGDALILTCQDGCNPVLLLARLRYDDGLHQWFLFSPEGKSGWRLCQEVSGTLDLDKLLQHILADPLNQFWPPSFTCFR